MKPSLFLFFVLIKSISAFSQVNEPKKIDSILNGINSIKTILDNSKAHKEEIEKFKNKLLKDSLDLEVEKKIIRELKDAAEKFATEKIELNNKLKQVRDSLKSFQSEYSNISDKQIESLLNEQFDKPGNLVFSKNSMSSILSFAQMTSSKKLNQIKAYINIYDSIFSVRKIFEEPFNKISIQQANKRVAAIETAIKNDLENNIPITNEVENLKKLLNRYCSNTFELYNLFFKIAPLAETNFLSSIDVKSAFRSEVEKAYYLVFQYKYLNEILNKFLLEPTYREQFKSKPTFTCN